VLAGVGAGSAKYDFRRRVGVSGVHDEDAAKNEADGVGDNGGSPGRDAASGDQRDDVAKHRVYVLHGSQYWLPGGEDFVVQVGAVVRRGCRLACKGRMAKTEAGGGVLHAKAAASAGAFTAAAAGEACGSRDGIG